MHRTSFPNQDFHIQYLSLATSATSFDVISPSCPKSAPGYSSRWTCPSQLRGARGAAAVLQTLSLRLSSDTRLRTVISAVVFTILFFLSLPTAQWGLQRWLTSKLRAISSGSTPSLPKKTGIESTSLHTSPESICQSLAPFSLQEPETLKLFHLGAKTLPTQIWQSRYGLRLPLRPQVLIFIPVASHLAANWRSAFDEASKVTSSAKSGDGILIPLDCDKGQPWNHQVTFKNKYYW